MLTRDRRAASWSAELELVVDTEAVDPVDCADSGRFGVNGVGRTALDADGVLGTFRLRDIAERWRISRGDLFLYNLSVESWILSCYPRS